MGEISVLGVVELMDGNSGGGVSGGECGRVCCHWSGGGIGGGGNGRWGLGSGTFWGGGVRGLLKGDVSRDGGLCGGPRCEVMEAGGDQRLEFGFCHWGCCLGSVKPQAEASVAGVCGVFKAGDEMLEVWELG